jgi:hypothetical protein
VPLPDTFKAWLDELAPKVLLESLLGKVIGYGGNQWPYSVQRAVDVTQAEGAVAGRASGRR